MTSSGMRRRRPSSSDSKARFRAVPKPFHFDVGCDPGAKAQARVPARAWAASHEILGASTPRELGPCLGTGAAEHAHGVVSRTGFAHFTPCRNSSAPRFSKVSCGRGQHSGWAGLAPYPATMREQEPDPVRRGADGPGAEVKIPERPPGM